MAAFSDESLCVFIPSNLPYVPIIEGLALRFFTERGNRRMPGALAERHRYLRSEKKRATFLLVERRNRKMIFILIITRFEGGARGEAVQQKRAANKHAALGSFPVVEKGDPEGEGGRRRRA